MAQGYLSIQARNFAGAQPIAGAQVTITDTNGNVLYRLTTDANGDTPSVALNAPDVTENSPPGTIPYTKYNVQISKNGFISQTIIGAEVFGNMSSTQPISLLATNPSLPSSQTIVIDDNQQVTGTQIQQIGPPPTPRTLTNVVIPTNVRVKLGTPSSSASIVTVPFVDYIKNVASSEIYPSPPWTAAAVEANVRAIISLLLNRIYTEWYPSQGYNFDVTNSTKREINANTSK